VLRQKRAASCSEFARPQLVLNEGRRQPPRLLAKVFERAVRPACGSGLVVVVAGGPKVSWPLRVLAGLPPVIAPLRLWRCSSFAIEGDGAALGAAMFGSCGRWPGSSKNQGVREERRNTSGRWASKRIKAQRAAHSPPLPPAAVPPAPLQGRSSRARFCALEPAAAADLG